MQPADYELHIFTNCTPDIRSKKTIVDTYNSFVKTFPHNVRPTVWVDSNPNNVAIEDYIAYIKDNLECDVVVTASFSDGYIQAIYNAKSNFLFMLEHDWIFQGECITHTLDQMFCQMREDKISHLKFNKNTNSESHYPLHYHTTAWDCVAEVNGKYIDYCTTVSGSNNPHILNLEVYRETALKYIKIEPKSYGIEHYLIDKPECNFAVYGKLVLGPTVTHLNGSEQYSNRSYDIKLAYLEIMGREADSGGFEHYYNSTLSIDEVRNILINSDEGRAYAITRLYELMLGRAPEAAALQTPGRLCDIQLGISESPEFLSKFAHTIPVEETTVDNQIPIFIINLKRRPDRRAQFEAKLNSLGIMNYEFVDATDVRELPDDLGALYDGELGKFNRPLARVEVACALSHTRIQERIHRESIPYAIILEDDADLNINFKRFLESFDVNTDYNIELLLLGSFSSNQYCNTKLKFSTAPVKLLEKESIIYLGPEKYKIGDISVHDTAYPTRTLDFIQGTHAYLVSCAGAGVLAKMNTPVNVEADNVWNYYTGIKLEVASPMPVFRISEDSDIQTARSEFTDRAKAYGSGYINKAFNKDFGT